MTLVSSLITGSGGDDRNIQVLREDERLIATNPTLLQTMW